MKDYIRDTYICFVKASDATQLFLKTKYKDKKMPNIGIWTLLRAKSLTERLLRADMVVRTIFDSCNIYRIVKSPAMTAKEIDAFLYQKWEKK